MAASGRACDLKLGRERRAVHRPVCCKRARVIKVSARDISRAGDPLWALAIAFSLWPAAVGGGCASRLSPGLILNRGGPGGRSPSARPPRAMLGWGLVAATAHPGSYSSEMSLAITLALGTYGLTPAWEFWSSHSLDGGISSKLLHSPLSVPSSVIMIHSE